MCCIRALIIYTLNSLHHEVVGSNKIISSNPRIPYNINTHTQHYNYTTTTLQLHYNTYPSTKASLVNPNRHVLTLPKMSCSGSSSGGGGGGGSMILYWYYIDIVYVCCLGVLIIQFLNSLHHEVVRTMLFISSNPRIPYNINTQTHIHTTLHYTTVVVIILLQDYCIYVLYRSPHN